MLGNCGVNWLPVSTSSDGSHTHTRSPHDTPSRPFRSTRNNGESGNWSPALCDRQADIDRARELVGDVTRAVCACVCLFKARAAFAASRNAFNTERKMTELSQDEVEKNV